MNKLQKLIHFLEKHNLSIAAAESCSGGYLSYLLTKIPGSSNVFKGSVITYSLEAKNKFFRIPQPLLQKTQGVSKAIAETLAKGTKKLFKSDIGVSIVGFAGPAARKGVPVGTVILSIADQKGVKTKKIVIRGNRDAVKKKASELLITAVYERTLLIY